MNLAFGKIIDSEESLFVINSLASSIAATLSQKDLQTSVVVDACEKLANSIGTQHLELLSNFGISEKKSKEYLDDAKAMLSKKALYQRIEKELGAHFDKSNVFLTNDDTLNVTEKISPLGVLLHITAGNQDGLAFYSVIEGLLTGNINIVKLSSKDDGLSVWVLKELIRIEPVLAEYIYVFDFPSSDSDTIRNLIDNANAVVVWGGDKAVQAIRTLATPHTQIIEWGHKTSFAYITERGMSETNLRGLASHIVKTNQLLCSSCQGVYIDTDSMDVVHDFCKTFLPILSEFQDAREDLLPIEVQAQNAIKVYVESLNATSRPCNIFRSAQTSIIAYQNQTLEASISHGNCWAKHLPHQDIVQVLRPNKNHLQTVALLCAEDEYHPIAQLLWKAGVLRVTDGENMSSLYFGAAHDGEYPLRRYTAVCSLEKIIR